jgi:hypothetical protein
LVSAMGKRIADKGSSEAFLRENLLWSSDDCLLWPYRLNNKGYGLAVIGGKQKTAPRWMCILAHGWPVAPRTDSAHSCGNPACVNPNHLRWATRTENMADKVLHGTTNRGERNWRTRLTAEDVKAIRAAPPDLAALMEKYGMSKHGLSKIRSGNRWKHIA